jgi:16S rRNA (adenine1518-N6/adenine1519-N6)-dimethyltransferase
LREVIARHGIAARRKLGQNFVLDLNLTRRIARAAGPLDAGTTIEIGPGPGGLTRALLAEGANRIVAVERDPRCIAALAELAALYPNRLAIVEGDALALDPVVLAETPRRIVANLPYNIATALLLRWLGRIGDYESLTLMFSARSPSGWLPRRAARPMAGCLCSCNGCARPASCSTSRRAPSRPRLR